MILISVEDLDLDNMSKIGNGTVKRFDLGVPQNRL